MQTTQPKNILKTPGYQPNYLPARHLVSDLPTLEDLRPFLERIDKNRWYTNFGPLVEEFEQKLTALLSAADPTPEHGPIAVSTIVTCYHALEVGLRLLGLEPGGKVLIPAISFPACPLAAQHAGGVVVFSEVDPVTWTLTPAIARKVAAKTKLAAVMPLALYGIPVPADEWDAFSQDTGIPVIIDAAAAIESQAIPKHCYVAHSLHATKPFGVGEGGVLVSRNHEMIRNTRLYANFGTDQRIGYTDGINAKMSEYHAAIGLAQAQRWEKTKRIRRDLLDAYRKQLPQLSGKAVPHPNIGRAVVSLFMLRLDAPIAQPLIERARHEGLAFHQTYLPPLYRHPHYANVALAAEDGTILPIGSQAEKKSSHMKHCEMLYRHLVGIPFHPFMSEEDVATVVAGIKRIIPN